MSRSPSQMPPACGFRKPLTTLKSVVLPAPFGPSTPTISSGLTARSTPSSAAIPPKCSVMSRVRRSVWRASDSRATSAQPHEQVGAPEVEREDGGHHGDPEGRPAPDQIQLQLADLQQPARPEQEER